jgi:hypothetical protein
MYFLHLMVFLAKELTGFCCNVNLLRKRTILLHSMGIISRTSPLKLGFRWLETQLLPHIIVCGFSISCSQIDSWLNNAGISQIDGNAWSSLQSDCRKEGYHQAWFSLLISLAWNCSDWDWFGPPACIALHYITNRTLAWTLIYLNHP